MNITIRQEHPTDFSAVFKLIETAFKNAEHSDHQEQFLVERLRNSEVFIPELSLIAVVNNNVVGYILLTKIAIKNNNDEYVSLALAPVAVLPEYQNKGIGDSLIRAAHKKAVELGYNSVILLGHKNYYPRFGYKTARNFGIQLPFDIPEENCMAIELTINALKNVKGIVIYPKAFFE